MNTSLLNNYGRGIFLGGLSIRIHWVSPLFRCSMFLLQAKFFPCEQNHFNWDFFGIPFCSPSALRMWTNIKYVRSGDDQGPWVGLEFHVIIPAIVVVLILGRAPLCMISRLLWHSLLSLLMSQKIAPCQSWVQNLN